MSKYFSYISFALAISGVALASLGIFYGYSYWWDELYSVTGAELSYNDMFRLFIFNDVHPPLYTMLLNGWVSVFGSAEQSTRSLSFIFSLLSLSAVWSWSKKNLEQIGFHTVIIFFATCSLFSYYAQETRSYAMMLFFATIMTTIWLSHWYKHDYRKIFVFCFIAIALSLTHYFGLIYAGLILMIALYDNIKQPKKAAIIAISGASCLVWPAFHLLYGGIRSKTGDNFWIKSDGWQSTLSTASSGLVPQFDILKKIIDASSSAYIIAIIFLLVLGFMYFLAKNQCKSFELDGDRNPTDKILLLILLFLIILVAIDSHTPISTHRNYIVLLPLFSIFIGLAAQGLKNYGFKWIFLVVVIGGTGNLATAAFYVYHKSLPFEDNANAVDFIKKNAGSEDNIYYLARPDSITMPEMQKMHKMMAEYYFKNGRKITPIAYEDLSYIKPPFFFLLQHEKRSPDELISELAKIGLNADYYAPQENSSVVVIYGK